MKRERPDISSHTYTPAGFLPSLPPPPPTMPELDDDSGRVRDAGDDELLAALGYKVRASEMADVAHKLEQLEMAMVTGGGDGGVGYQGYEDGLLSHFAVDTVHYNPADISNWLENMLSEINPSPAPTTGVAAGDAESTTVTAVEFPGAAQIYDESDCDDLRAIPGELVFGGKHSVSDSSSATEDSKRQKTSPKQAQIPAVAEPASRTMVLVDSQETGIRLVHSLMACAEAIQQDDVKAADALVKQISLLAAAQAGPMRKVATYFADALARRIFYSRYCPRPPPADSIDPAIADMLEMHFYETCPYLKFAHFTANQAVLEAFAGKSHVHVIDFGMKQGMQWPALMQALALRPGGPPAFRLTGIGPPQPDDRDALQQVGWRLARLAETVGVEFEYRGFVAASLADLEPYMLDVRPEEAVAVNSVFELHRLLARPGAAEKVLATVKAVKPDIVTVVEQEADHNGAVFLDRFTEALHYYSTVFDSLEGGAGGGEEQVMAEMYVGRQIQNVVACEGVERVERHEMLRRWRGRMEGAGFDAVHLGSNAFKQASMLLALFAGGDGYRVEEKNGCLMLGWHTRPLIATSAWKPQPPPPPH